MTTLHVVLPAGVDDPAGPSGGNRYDRRACDELAAQGWRVVEHAADGDWPRPDAAQVARLAATLAAVPDGGLILLDGLVACAAPDVVVPAAARLRLAVLVHLPLVDEAGDGDLDARERETLRAAGAVIATSEGAARRLAALHGLDGVRVAAPGVDPAPRSAGTANGSRLLCVAAVIPRKAQDVLVSALASVAELDWTCDFAGALDRDPPYAARVAAAADELGGRVNFAGPLVGAELDARYAEADLLVLPSRAETYGMVVTEALARGVPVLATDVSGVPEALGWAPAPPDQADPPDSATPSGRLADDASQPRPADPSSWSLTRPGGAGASQAGTGAVAGGGAGAAARQGVDTPGEPAGSGWVRPGMLVPPGDSAALADALRRWLTQPEVRVKLRAAAAARRSTLDGWDATARALAAVLDAL
ncbi:glycosyltransferase family 4 protein [Phytohabitans flavus]|uniref:Glycosyl transferase n=1 Tax=Phytohabitans flavus TaxID=1076124 RepID=A0A6F8XQU9_9ACTN|nr:glycosyltransferase family 4 protein [Phytohabitans flavus]BCB76121.1 glycosyl transferase [Phytohabitans flavus]